MVIYGRLHTRVNYDSKFVVKPYKVKIKSLQNLYLLWKAPKEGQLRLKLCRQAYVKHKKQFDFKIILVIYGRLHTRVDYKSNGVVRPCNIKTIRCKNYFVMADSTRETITTQTVSSSLVNKTNSMQKLFCNGRLHTRVNYGSNCVVKSCETEKILVKYFGYLW